tara:strand:+ start:280 stop:831 length:552 start_codon:yes stop_codon:yes gene_type:complete
MPVNASNNNLGMIAPDFNLLDVSGRYYDLNSLKGENGTVVAFICNHCPYVKAIAKNLSFEANELKKFSINVIAIMSNDVIQYPDDSFENMKIFSKNYNFNFYYLYDDTQQVAKNYGAVCTPDFFGFNQSLKLMYRGRIDSSNVNSNNNLIQRDLYNAMIQIYKKGNAPKEQINSIGCSIKWKK